MRLAGGAILFGAVLAVAAPPPAALAKGDVAAGRALAGTCRVCHGLDGVGTNPTIPNIGGQSEMYLVKQLQDFREGRRENEQMSIIAEGLSDADIADLSAYYAAVVATFVAPE